MQIKKIGIDFHGVINTNPEFFRDFANMARKHGIKIHIISGGPREYIIQYLQNYNIQYDKIWCIFDYYCHKNKVTFLPDGSFYVSDILWDSAKAQYCARENIDLHIDDSSVYKTYFTGRYCQYDRVNKLGYINDTPINFAKLPQTVLADLINFFAELPA